MEFKFSKPKKSFKKKNFQLNADFYWKIVFSVASLFVLLSFAFGTYLFFQIDKDFTSTEGAVTEPTKTVKKERINGALEYFTERKSKSEDILHSPSPIVDPSF